MAQSKFFDLTPPDVASQKEATSVSTTKTAAAQNDTEAEGSRDPGSSNILRVLGGNAMRIGSGWVASGISAIPTPANSAAGFAIGALGEGAAELIEGTPISPARMAAEGTISAIPLGKIYKAGEKGLNVARGILTTEGGNMLRRKAEGRSVLPDNPLDIIMDVGTSAIGGAAGYSVGKHAPNIKPKNLTDPDTFEKTFRDSLKTGKPDPTPTLNKGGVVSQVKDKDGNVVKTIYGKSVEAKQQKPSGVRVVRQKGVAHVEPSGEETQIVDAVTGKTEKVPGMTGPVPKTAEKIRRVENAQVDKVKHPQIAAINKAGEAADDIAEAQRLENTIVDNTGKKTEQAVEKTHEQANKMRSSEEVAAAKAQQGVNDAKAKEIVDVEKAHQKANDMRANEERAAAKAQQSYYDDIERRTNEETARILEQRQFEAKAREAEAAKAGKKATETSVSETGSITDPQTGKKTNISRRWIAEEDDIDEVGDVLDDLDEVAAEFGEYFDDADLAHQAARGLGGEVKNTNRGYQVVPKGRAGKNLVTDGPPPPKPGAVDADSIGLNTETGELTVPKTLPKAKGPLKVKPKNGSNPTAGPQKPAQEPPIPPTEPPTAPQPKGPAPKGPASGPAKPGKAPKISGKGVAKGAQNVVPEAPPTTPAGTPAVPPKAAKGKKTTPAVVNDAPPTAPETAAEQVADEMERVVDLKGVKGAKEIHSRVLNTLEEAKANADYDGTSTALNGPTTKSEPRTLTVRIPGDGTLKIKNTKDAIQRLQNRLAGKVEPGTKKRGETIPGWAPLREVPPRKPSTAGDFFENRPMKPESMWDDLAKRLEKGEDLDTPAPAAPSSKVPPARTTRKSSRTYDKKKNPEGAAQFSEEMARQERELAGLPEPTGNAMPVNLENASPELAAKASRAAKLVSLYDRYAKAFKRGEATDLQAGAAGKRVAGVTDEVAAMADRETAALLQKDLDEMAAADPEIAAKLGKFEEVSPDAVDEGSLLSGKKSSLQDKGIEPLMTLDQASEATGIPKRTLEYNRKNGRLKVTTEAGDPRIRKEWLDEFVANKGKRKPLSDAAGYGNIELMTSLGGAALGGAAGAALSEDDPLSGAALGAGLGASSPFLVGKGINALKDRGGIDWEDVVHAAHAVGERLPNYQRASLLSNPFNLAYNAFAGPWGSGVVGSLERRLAGDENAGNALKEMLNVRKWAREYRDAVPEAFARVGENERADYTEIANPGLIDWIMGLPGSYMTSGDMATNRTIAPFMGEAEARVMTMTNEPEGAFVGNIANFGKHRDPSGALSIGAKLMLPFKRTTLNVLSSTPSRTPVVGAVINAFKKAENRLDKRTLAVQQGLGAVIAGTAYALGAAIPTSESQRYKIHNLVQNLGGQYSMIASMGYAAGQASRRGNSEGRAILNQLWSGYPLPSTQMLGDLARPIVDTLEGRPANWSGIKRVAIPGIAQSLLDAIGEANSVAAQSGMFDLSDEEGE